MDVVRGPAFLPQRLLERFATVRTRVFLASPEQMTALQSLSADMPTLDSIVLQFDADRDQVQQLQEAFRGVRLLEPQPGTTWLRPILR